MATGIICEYNPFHKGHAYHLQTIRQHTGSSPIIGVMSGHYVQRAEPAMLDKWTRTRMALASGMQMVIELPTYYSTATAEWFAYGAVSLLAHTGLVDTLSFGMAHPEQLPALQTLSSHLAPESPVYQRLLHEGLQQKLPFAVSREHALAQLAEQPLSLREPNTILVLEYIKALRRTGFSPALLPVARRSAAYHDLSLSAEYPSASAIRRAAQNGQSILPYLPPSAAAHASPAYVFPDSFFAPLAYAISLHTRDSLRHIAEINEGLENRLLEAALDSPSYGKLLSRLKTKRYPTSRLRRVLLNLLLQITDSKREALHFTSGPAYLRVLGVRRDAKALLSALIKHADLPVVTNLARQIGTLPEPAQSMLRDEIRFSQIYASSHPQLLRDAEYRTGLVVI